MNKEGADWAEWVKFSGGDDQRLSTARPSVNSPPARSLDIDRVGSRLDTKQYPVL